MAGQEIDMTAAAVAAVDMDSPATMDSSLRRCRLLVAADEVADTAADEAGQSLQKGQIPADSSCRLELHRIPADSRKSVGWDRIAAVHSVGECTLELQH